MEGENKISRQVSNEKVVREMQFDSKNWRPIEGISPSVNEAPGGPVLLFTFMFFFPVWF